MTSMQWRAAVYRLFEKTFCKPKSKAKQSLKGIMCDNSKELYKFAELRRNINTRI